MRPGGGGSGRGDRGTIDSVPEESVRETRRGRDVLARRDERPPPARVLPRGSSAAKDVVLKKTDDRKETRVGISEQGTYLTGPRAAPSGAMKLSRLGSATLPDVFEATRVDANPESARALRVTLDAFAERSGRTLSNEKENNADRMKKKGPTPLTLSETLKLRLSRTTTQRRSGSSLARAERWIHALLEKSSHRRARSRGDRAVARRLAKCDVSFPVILPER